jgi:hypothetical protein
MLSHHNGRLSLKSPIVMWVVLGRGFDALTNHRTSVVAVDFSFEFQP